SVQPRSCNALSSPSGSGTPWSVRILRPNSRVSCGTIDCSIFVSSSAERFASMPSYLLGMTMSTPYGRSPMCSSIQFSSISSSSGVNPTAPRTPKPPALATATTTSRQWVNAKIGNSMPSSSQMGVCIRHSSIERRKTGTRSTLVPDGSVRKARNNGRRLATSAVTADVASLHLALRTSDNSALAEFLLLDVAQSEDLAVDRRIVVSRDGRAGATHRTRRPGERRHHTGAEHVCAGALVVMRDDHVARLELRIGNDLRDRVHRTGHHTRRRQVRQQVVERPRRRPFTDEGVELVLVHAAREVIGEAR